MLIRSCPLFLVCLGSWRAILYNELIIMTAVSKRVGVSGLILYTYLIMTCSQLSRYWGLLLYTYLIMTSGTTISSTNWLSSPLTACLFCNLTFMAIDCSWSVWISLLILLRSPWKPFSIRSIRWDEKKEMIIKLQVISK